MISIVIKVDIVERRDVDALSMPGTKTDVERILTVTSYSEVIRGISTKERGQEIAEKIFATTKSKVFSKSELMTEKNCRVTA